MSADIVGDFARERAESDGNNPHPEGSLEWYAWGFGYNYAETHAYRDAPLSGEFADDPVPYMVVRMSWVAVMGGTWDTFTDGTDDDRDSDDDICAAWEAGATARWEEGR